MAITASPEPTGSLDINRDLRDGAGYRLTAEPGYITAITLRDPHGDVACIAIDRIDVRQLIDDLMLVAGLTPTPARVPLATALAGSVRTVFERLDQLDKINAFEAAKLRKTMVDHLRSSAPMTLLGVAP